MRLIPLIWRGSNVQLEAHINFLNIRIERAFSKPNPFHRVRFSDSAKRRSDSDAFVSPEPSVVDLDIAHNPISILIDPDKERSNRFICSAFQVNLQHRSKHAFRIVSDEPGRRWFMNGM